jgi:hypothetical protein
VSPLPRERGAMVDMSVAQETQDEAVYVYGIVPADVEVEPDVHGVGDPPREVSVIRQGDIAALVSRVPPDRPLGTPEDLTAHSQLLDSAAAHAPVLPLKFGAVVTDEQTVERELLGEHHDTFRAALEELEGRAEYVIKGRYVQDVVLREVAEENDEVMQLRERISGKPEDATRNDRIALGELVTNAIEAKRERDTAAVAEALAALDVKLTVRPPTHEEDAVHVACLAETARQADLEDEVERFAGEWDGRVTLRLLGPLAPYDFVTTTAGG